VVEWGNVVIFELVLIDGVFLVVEGVECCFCWLVIDGG